MQHCVSNAINCLHTTWENEEAQQLLYLGSGKAKGKPRIPSGPQGYTAHRFFHKEGTPSCSAALLSVKSYASKAFCISLILRRGKGKKTRCVSPCGQDW